MSVTAGNPFKKTERTPAFKGALRQKINHTYIAIPTRKMLTVPKYGSPRVQLSLILGNPFFEVSQRKNSTNIP
jgi:hypothetical protein